MSSTPDRLPHPPSIGAVVYAPDRPPEALLSAFAAELSARGFRIGGLVQETKDAAEGKCTMEVVELDTGRRLSLTQDLGGGSNSCALDPAALAEASGAVRRAVADGVDLLFVNKFSKLEKTGRGLAAEMLATMAAGVPLLTALPGVLMDEWVTFTGGRGQVLMPTPEALWQWWGPGRLYDDLALGVGLEPALRIVSGQHWIMVEGPHGAGLAANPGGPAGHWTGKPLRELAALVRSWDPFEAALGMAAINAHYNRFDLDTGPVDALDCANVVTVGTIPDAAIPWLLPQAEGIIIPASALTERTLPNLLRLSAGIPVVLTGPGATLTRRLLSYGVTTSHGLIVTDVDGLARAVTECAADVTRFGKEAGLS